MITSVECTLYVDGANPRSSIAHENLKVLCRKYLGTSWEIRVVDVARNPEIAVQEQIVALPTLEVQHSGKKRRLVGDLSLGSTFLGAIGMAESALQARGALQSRAARKRGKL